jgi:hypothetical protein
MKDEWRIRNEMKNMAVAEGLYEEEKSDDPNSFTVYNQNL